MGETYSKQSSLLVVDGRKADLRVDVEEALLSARRPDGRLNTKLVGLEVVVIVRAVEGEGAGDLVGEAREVVGRLADALVTLLEVGVATVVNLEDRVLPWMFRLVSKETFRLVMASKLHHLRTGRLCYLHP